MKKIIFSLIILIFFSQNSFAKTKIVKGQYYEGEIKFYDLKYNLPNGKWLSLGKKKWTMGEVPNIGVSCIIFVQLEDRLYKSGIEICEIHTSGSYTGYIGMYMNKELNSGRYDSCTLRPEYFYTNLWTRGMSGNCFKTRHIDVDKTLNYPDDPERTYTFFKKFIRKCDLFLNVNILFSLSI